MQQQIENLINQHQGSSAELLQSLSQNGLAKLITELVAEEVKQFLGREHYQRREDGQEHKRYHNGYRDRSFEST